jgi:hypothetical protein
LSFSSKKLRPENIRFSRALLLVSDKGALSLSERVVVFS